MGNSWDKKGLVCTLAVALGWDGGLALGVFGCEAWAAAPTVGGHPSPRAESGDDPALEAQREMQNYESELKKVVDPINSINPFFTGVRPSPGPSGAPAAALGENAAKAMQFVEQVRKWVEHPFVRSLLKALADQKLSDSLAKIWESPSRPHLIYGQGIGFVVIWLLGMYRRTRALTFLKRLWISVSQLALNLLVLGVLVPWVTLGTPWLDFLGGVARAIQASSVASSSAPAQTGATPPSQ